MVTNPLVVIVGPTASGKTSLAIELAKQFNGEIICADSRTIYRAMDIGTAKPTKEEQNQVPHWGLDLVEPGQSYSAADFKKYAVDKIEEIRSRNRVPFLVGGTGLYVDSVLFDFEFGPPSDPRLRKELVCMDLEQLHLYCMKNNILLPENEKNKRYVIRAIEQKSINRKRKSFPIENSIVVGISTEKSVLRERIELRAEQILQDGVIEEAKKIGERYGWDSEAMTGNIYPLCYAYLRGTISIEELKHKFITLDWHLAKRQLTWLRRNTYIEWLSLDKAEQYLISKLASEQ